MYRAKILYFFIMFSVAFFFSQEKKTSSIISFDMFDSRVKKKSVILNSNFFNKDLKIEPSNKKIVLINEDQDWNRPHFSYYTSTSNVPITFIDMINWHLINKKKYVVEIETDEPLLFNFSGDWKNLMVYAFPGDTLKFKSSYTVPYLLNGNRPYEELMFFSFLNAFGNGFNTHNGIVQEYISPSKLNDFEKQATERYTKRINFLKEMASTYNFTELGKSTIDKAIYYEYVKELFTAYLATVEKISDRALIPDKYKSKLRSFSKELLNDSFMYLIEYRGFVFCYANFLMIEEGIRNADFITTVQSYKKNFTGKKRDFLLNNEIHSNFIRDIPLTFKDIKNATDSIQDKDIRDTIFSIYNRSKRELTWRCLETIIESPTGEKMKLNNLMDMNKQKLIYLDFWATWCGPCLLEMPNSRELANGFINKEVEFVYISIDKDKEKWKKKLATLHKGKNVHYYLMSPESDLAKELEIPPIPRYVLIGKGGKLISIDAPRPQSKEVRELILESLLEK